MIISDKDLRSIQEARHLIAKAKAAQKLMAEFRQEQLDSFVKAMANAGVENSEKLAKLAAVETGFGKWEDKILKNLFASQMVYDSIKDLKTVGILDEDEQQKIMEVGVPLGVITALIPSTNPTSTTIFKALISIKAGNAVIFSPHPSALNCTLETVRVLKEAAMKAGCPEDAISVLTNPTIEGTDTLMKDKDIALILATGGSGMVKAAYSSGTPAIGVGPGNAPAFIERSANIPLAVKRIFDSKTFDNGVICASEQSIIVEECIRERVIEECVKLGGYFLSSRESRVLEKYMMRANGTMNPAIVGKTVEQIAKLADLQIPAGTRVLIAEETRVGRDVPYSREKLAPILAFYTEKDWEAACQKCIEILFNEGAGHTLIIHSENKEVIKEFALKKPVSRLLINTPGALGGIGATTNLFPSLTLGCGAIGGGSTSDNIGPLHLINIRRVANGVKEIDDLKVPKNNEMPCVEQYNQKVLIEKVIKQVLAELT